MERMDARVMVCEVVVGLVNALDTANNITHVYTLQRKFNGMYPSAV